MSRKHCTECGQHLRAENRLDDAESVLLRICDHIESNYPESWRMDAKFEEMIAEARKLLGLPEEKPSDG